MHEGDENAITSLVQLVDLISNLDQVLKYLRDNNAITEEEEQEIVNTPVFQVTPEATFNKTSQLLMLIKEKDDEASFNHLKEALKSTGNGSAADKLTSRAVLDQPYTTNNAQADAQIKDIESPPPHPQPDQEGMVLAVEMEKEFDRIQSEAENETVAEIIQVDVEQHAQNEEHHSEIRVEITEPTELEVEVTPEEELTIVADAESVPDDEDVSDEVKIQVEATPEVEVQPPTTEVEPAVPEASKTPKQVTFGETSHPEQKSFVLNDDREESESPSDLKSIVALNREKFEKSSPNGGGPKVKYSFAKKGGVVAAAPKEEEPKESTVKNLRNFFQKLGSVDAEEGSVLKRSPGAGVRTSGAQNRRTMI